MDLIEGYQISSSSDRDECELGKHKTRNVYLVTYSQLTNFVRKMLNAYIK